jgi:hypothetical protein
MKSERRKKKILVRIVIAAIILLVVMQAFPYGRDHSNPPILQEPRWDSPATRELFFRTCKNCHSNETQWPWYSNLAPVSWLVQSDVAEGRSRFNISDWRERVNKGDEAAELLSKGEMPPWYYLPLHPEAHLSKSEREQLSHGLTATFGNEKGSAAADTDK